MFHSWLTTRPVITLEVMEKEDWVKRRLEKKKAERKTGVSREQRDFVCLVAETLKKNRVLFEGDTEILGL